MMLNLPDLPAISGDKSLFGGSVLADVTDPPDPPNPPKNSSGDNGP